jgi:hypothetical protein
MASNSGDSSLPRTQVLSSQPPPPRAELPIIWQSTTNWVLSLSYITTDGQSASLSWSKAPMWDLRPDFYYCLTIAVFWYGAPSLTRGRVCLLQCTTYNIFYCLRFEIRSLYLYPPGARWPGYTPRHWVNPACSCRTASHSLPKCSKSKSKSYCDWQSVSQSVLVSYPIWGIWPEICLLFISEKNAAAALYRRGTDNIGNTSFSCQNFCQGVLHLRCLALSTLLLRIRCLESVYRVIA